MNRRPKMIGAHVAPKAKGRSNPGREAAREFNRAFDQVFAKKPGRTHLAYQPVTFSGVVTK